MTSLEANKKTLLETARKIAALNVWELAASYNWAIRPYGSVFPYFFTMIYDKNDPAFARILFLEGWQTMHDYVRLNVDPDAGYYCSIQELPQFQLCFKRSGEVTVVRQDPGYIPIEPTPKQFELLVRLLWEAYGVLLHIESDKSLILKYSDERALFSRVEVAPGQWRDEPFAIPMPPPYKEEISIPKEVFDAAKAMPPEPGLRIAADFRIHFTDITHEPVPRFRYVLRAVDLCTGERIIDESTCVDPQDGGLKGRWLIMPGHLLERLVAKKKMPCEIQVISGRVFRFLRPIILNLPIKLTKKESIPALEKYFDI